MIKFLFLSLLGVLGAFQISAETPKSILIYYGFPSLINGSTTVAQAAIEYGMYDFVVLGNCIEEDGSANAPFCPNGAHGDHNNTIDIIADATTHQTKFFGYIDLGVSTQNLTLVEIERRTVLWSAMGVEGIFLDDYGYDFGVNRERQNEAVNIIHGLGLSVIANGFFVDDVFSSVQHPVNNSMGDATALNNGDYYLFESHQIRNGAFVPEIDWQNKANSLAVYKDSIGFNILSITTSLLPVDYMEDNFFYSWYSAAMYEHIATGWGEPNFSASAPSANIAPFRTRPSIEIGGFISPISQQGSIYMRSTCDGILEVNAAMGVNTYNFTSEACLIFIDGFETTL